MSADRGKVWIGTSWKMNKTLAEATRFADALRMTPAPARVQRFVIPPFTAAREVADALNDTGVKVGAQNMHWADNGAWTGEISAPMLVDCGIDLVELGHSERRAHFGETDETVGLKTRAALRHRLQPLVCVGETAAEKSAGAADAVLRRQVTTALAGVSSPQSVLIAYEPVWAIGESGRPASPAYADERQRRIADVAEDLLGERPPCLYGGSVNAGNCVDLITCPHIDGLFVGRAAWEAEGYLAIVNACASALAPH